MKICEDSFLILAAHSSLLTPRCSLLAAHCSLLAAHSSLLTPRCSLLAAQFSLPNSSAFFIQINQKSSAFVFFALHFDAPTEGFNLSFDQVQTQALAASVKVKSFV
jgi:hypothetical protein